MNFTVYGIRIKGDKEVRYVGQTNGPIDVRLAGHILTAQRKPYGSNPDLAAWLIESGDQIEAFKIGYADTREEALGIEKAIIALCLRLEHRLFNRKLLPTALQAAA